MPDTPANYLSSSDVCRIAGVTYRQLDYLARNGIFDAWMDIPATPGSGRHRAWHPDLVARLVVAQALATTQGHLVDPNGRAGSLWPSMADITTHGPTPLPAGFAIIDRLGTIRYTATLTPTDVPAGALVLSYDATTQLDQLLETTAA